MDYVRLGNTGLQVSRLALGCMSFGASDRGAHAWTLDEEASRALIRQAYEAGVTFWDTANTYSAGNSEEIVGRALNDIAPREEIVLATKVFSPMRPGTNGGGLSRRAILEQVDNSLRRLRTDYIDLYQIHRWDYDTPIEETLDALNDLVRVGKVRYIGASSMHAWQFAKALFTSQAHGFARFVSMQDHYNLLYREEEREMLPLCTDQGIGVIPWSPLARGRLARPWDAVTARSETDEFGQSLYHDDDREIVSRVAEVAAKRGVPPARIALAWMLHKPVITAPIVGATKPEHLADAVAALEIDLTDDEVAYVESPYQPRRTAGFR